MHRNIEIKIRLTAEEVLRLNHNAKSTGRSRESYIRALITGTNPVQLPPMEYYAAIRELRAIGNNLHQIAYKANAIGLIDAPAYRRNAEYIVAAADKLLAATAPRKE